MERQAEEYQHGLLFLQIPRESGCTERETKVLSFSSKKPLIHGFFRLIFLLQKQAMLETQKDSDSKKVNDGIWL